MTYEHSEKGCESITKQQEEQARRELGWRFYNRPSSDR